ncbi:MAG TPA: methyltransferase domain-containing protein [Candidatus Acidoferrales bacterium]|jgi:2-polyprenyl-3-methyl-5-hydroxy-6-metoxy-1,4-benzoquinol methylase|nr:methyltransferase domain-containing protein [Candidatus Acidoferrales bacterium]
MNLKSVEWLRCIGCGAPLRAEYASPPQKSESIEDGQLICTSCGRVFPIVRSIARFVPSEDYAQSFGYQWNYFDKTQLDSHMGNDLSRERFFATTQWPQKMEGQVILEAGCGMGRFTQIALETGAEIVSFDLSTAVEANLRNNGDSSSVQIVQASIYEIPLKKESFDKVFCMGVLQHCPDVRAAFMSLVPFLKPGGEIVIDVYQKHTGLFPPLKYWARPFLTWMGPKGVHRFLSMVIPPAFYLKKALYKIPVIGKPIGNLIPIGPISHAPRLIFTDEVLVQVKILSALDMFSPVHDHPQTLDTVRQWFADAGLVDVYVGTGFNGVNARGRKP